MQTRGILIVLLVSLGTAVKAEDESQYAAVDRHALNVPSSMTTSIKVLSSYLTKPFTSDEEKARVIFRWIADNISYDVEGYFSGGKTETESGDVLKSRSSVCAGYSSLFEALGTEAGLEVVTIDGYAKGFSYQPGDKVTGESNHAWNALKIRGEWKLIDCTWGAGKVDDGHKFVKAFEPYFFCTKPEEFIYRHLPTNNRWQLLPKPLSRQEFEDLPFVYPAYFQNALNMKNNQTVILQTSSEYMMEFSVPSQVLCMADLEQKGRKLDDAVFLQRSGSSIQLRVIPPEPGEYILNIFAKKRTDSGMLPIAVGYKVIAHSAGTKNTAFPLTFNAFIEKDVQLQSPLEKELPSGSMQLFKLTAPAAEKVAVVCEDEWDFLKRNGNQYEGNVEIGTGKVTVYAQYPLENNFQALLEYTGTGTVKHAPAPVKFKKYVDSGAELIAPPKKELPAGTKQIFRIKLPGAKKAAVVFGEKWQFLQQSGDWFEGEIVIGKGKNMVLGAYTNTTDFDGLLEYEGK